MATADVEYFGGKEWFAGRFHELGVEGNWLKLPGGIWEFASLKGGSLEWDPRDGLIMISEVPLEGGPLATAVSRVFSKTIGSGNLIIEMFYSSASKHSSDLTKLITGLGFEQEARFSTESVAVFRRHGYEVNKRAMNSTFAIILLTSSDWLQQNAVLRMGLRFAGVSPKTCVVISEDTDGLPMAVVFFSIIFSSHVREAEYLLIEHLREFAFINHARA